MDGIFSVLHPIRLQQPREALALLVRLQLTCRPYIARCPIFYPKQQTLMLPLSAYTNGVELRTIDPVSETMTTSPELVRPSSNHDISHAAGFGWLVNRDRNLPYIQVYADNCVLYMVAAIAVTKVRPNL